MPALAAVLETGTRAGDVAAFHVYKVMAPCVRRACDAKSLPAWAGEDSRERLERGAERLYGDGIELA